MAVSYYQLNRSTTSIPSTTGATTYTDGFYGVPGTLEFLVWRLQVTTAGGGADLTTSLAALVSQFKLVVDGSILYDWTSGFAPDAGSTQTGNWNYFLQSIGGRAYQVPSADGAGDKEVYMAIPVGINLQGVSTPRFEITYGFYDAQLVIGAGATISGGASTYWARFNQATQRSTRVISSTSFQHAANQTEQVVVRIPTMPGFVLDSILIQNDSSADQYGADGIRILSLSQFSMPIDLHRWASNELGNRFMTMNPTATTDSQSAQTFKNKTPGVLSVPLYGLASGDLVLLVQSSAATTRFYTPVLTSVLGGQKMPVPRQTVMAPGNTQQAMSQPTEVN